MAITDTPVTVLYVHSSDELYGSDVVLLQLIRSLDQSRFRPLVVLPRDLPYEGKLSQALTQLDVSCLRMDIAVLRRRYFTPGGILHYLWRLARGTWQLVRLMRREQVALVHSNTGAVWTGALACRLTKRPHLWHIHEIVTHPTVVRRSIAWMATHFSDRVVAISQAVRTHLLQDHPKQGSRVVVICDGVETDRFQPANDGTRLRQDWGVGPDEVLIGQMGRVSTWKGQEDFIEAAQEVTGRNPQARFVIVGDVLLGEEGLREALHAQAAALGDRVIWAGYQDDAPQVMAALDMLVLPSRLPEPFGMVLLEAMASGKPVVATRHGGPLEIVVDGETGVLVPPRDPQALAAAIARLVADPSLRQQMGEAGRALTEQVFSLERQVTQFQQLYDELLGGGR